MTEVERLTKLLAKAQAASMKAAMARHDLGPGATRARVTTANARWMRAAEHRDRIQEQLDKATQEEAAQCDK